MKANILLGWGSAQKIWRTAGGKLLWKSIVLLQKKTPISRLVLN